jgi:hypothetical protein
MRKRARRRSKGKTPPKRRDWIAVDDPEARDEGSDAGDDSDLEAARIAKTVQGYRTLANQGFAAAARKARAGRAQQAERYARQAIDASVRAFWWAEGTPAEEAQHRLMHRIGRWTRRTLGCNLHFNGTSYEHVCPIRIAHKRMGLSIGYVTNPICSLCGDELSECPHIRGRSYWVRGGVGPSGYCPVCLLQDDCDHRSDRLYRVSVVSIVTNGEVREVSWVGRPGVPEARILSLPIDTQGLVARLPSEFRVGMPVNCDFCLLPCDGFEEPFGDVTSGDAPSDAE